MVLCCGVSGAVCARVGGKRWLSGRTPERVGWRGLRHALVGQLSEATGSSSSSSSVSALNVAADNVEAIHLLLRSRRASGEQTPGWTPAPPCAVSGVIPPHRSRRWLSSGVGEESPARCFVAGVTGLAPAWRALQGAGTGGSISQFCFIDARQPGPASPARAGCELCSRFHLCIPARPSDAASEAASCRCPSRSPRETVLLT